MRTLRKSADPITGNWELATADKIRVAVIGVGAFGRNHARVYHDLQQQGEAVELAGVVDADANRAAEIAQRFGTRAFGSLRELIQFGNINAATVAVPTVQHLSVARELMAAGIDVLIEKPIASTLQDADELIRLGKGRMAQAGHLERFNPAVRATMALITRPMFFEVHRLSVFTPRSLDVDVVLDLMIHDLDIVLAMVASPVKEIRAVGLPILSGRVDIANVRMEFASGCVANFTASRVSTERVRKLRFFQPHQYISVDYTRQDLLVFTVDAAAQSDPAALAAMVAEGGADIGSQIKMSRPEVQSEEPLRAELRAFLEAVRQRTRPVVPLEEGRRALAAALEILDSIREHARRVNLDKIALGAPTNPRK